MLFCLREVQSPIRLLHGILRQFGRLQAKLLQPVCKENLSRCLQLWYAPRFFPSKRFYLDLFSGSPTHSSFYMDAQLLIYKAAYDDQTSTFILPSGGGFEVVFCPKGRSSNILKVLGDQLRAVAASGGVSEQIIQELAIGTYPAQSLAIRQSLDTWLGLVVVVMAAVLFFPP